MSSELVPSRGLLELDGRRSGNVYYQLLCHLGSRTLAIIARDANETRAIAILASQGNDAMLHPEVYLGSADVIYGAPDDADDVLTIKAA